MSFKYYIKSALPTALTKPVRKVYRKIKEKREQQLISKMPKLYENKVQEIRTKKRPIKVVFFALMDSVWKYDVLYKLMEKDDRFHPVILVCPVVNNGKANMLRYMENCFALFKAKGYKVIRSYDEITNRYIDVKKDLNPDIIFYTNPYEGLIDDRYYIYNYKDVLTCYTSYFFTITPLRDLTDTILHNLVWRRYVENDLMMEDAIINNRNHGSNCINTGYPGFDTLVQINKRFSDPWKIKNHSIKRVIWAPHHSISETAQINYSTFLDYSEFMFEIAKKYKDKIQICFKPHPLLKSNLELMWGKEKTMEYYEKWQNLDNGMLNDGAYEELFLTSDAMIHDSSSFLGEYLVTGKPVIYLTNNNFYRNRFNEIGLACLDKHYIAGSKDDIDNILTNIIMNVDPIKQERINFVENILLPKNGKLASENIIENLASELMLA